MVMTRRQWREWRDRGFPSTQESECEECEQAQNEYEYINENTMEPVPNEPYRSYTPNDRCNRHRLPDNVPYTEEVRSYRRRK